MTDTEAVAPEAQPFSLGDRYTTIAGEILATGVQALARLPLDQMRADRRAGLNTAAFISGYQGSPLGGYDRELQSQRALLDEFARRPPARPQRGARRHRGHRQPAVLDLRLPPLRRRSRHLVRQVPGRRPGRRRHPPRQLCGHGPARRRPGADRRRPGLQVDHAAVPLRGHPRRARPRRPLPRHRAGRAGPRAPRRRAVESRRRVDGHQDRHRRSPTAPARPSSIPIASGRWCPRSTSRVSSGLRP